MARILALAWPDLRVPEVDATPFEPMLDALDDLSPRVEAVAVGVALVDVTGLEALIGPERRVAARAVQLARGVAPLTVRCGIGDNRWLASLAARLARPERVGAPAALHILPAGPAGRAVLRDLPVTLLPTDRATRDRLALFGLTSMGQLADLPRAAVGAQFGVIGERLQQLARGLDPRPIAPRRRPERLVTERTFETPLESVGAIALVLRAVSAELCEALTRRNLAPGRATLAVRLEDAPALRVELAFPEPAREPDWIARLLIGRLEALARTRLVAEEEPRIAGLRLTLDRLADPRGRQLPAFEPQAGKWEELRWSLERLAARFGEGRLWRAELVRPHASRPEVRARLLDIGP
jgi:nucleotidyltransferase/DNA polymerase involved in DNA repair